MVPINTAELKQKIKDSPAKQGEIAKFLGITEAYLSLMLSGKRPLSYDLFKKILNYVERAHHIHELTRLAMEGHE